MKLIEILQQEQPQQTREPFKTYLDRLRYGNKKTRKQKVIGSGYYSDVFQHPKYDAVIVKVSTTGTHILEYLQYAMRNQHNPYVPKIYGIRKFVNPNGGKYFIVFMEKLEDYDHLSNERKIELLRQHVGGFVNQYVKTYGDVFNFFEEISLWNVVRGLKKMKRPTKLTPYLIDVLTYIARKGRSKDMHDANLMIRPPNQIVITDPLG